MLKTGLRSLEKELAFSVGAVWFGEHFKRVAKCSQRFFIQR